MNWREEALTFACSGERLLGIVARPAAPCEAGVVIIVGGPQYRAGSHRQFVSLARRLADAGVAVLRFDCRGMGDSSGQARSFEEISDDIGSAIDAMHAAVPSLRRLALWGLCDGASAALLYLGERGDPRVTGLGLLNPWVRSQASLAKTHVKHYYGQRLRERAFWLKLARGQVALSAVAGLWGNVRRSMSSAPPGLPSVAPFQQRMARGWQAFDGPVLLLMSERDHTANEFDEFTRGDPEWQRALAAHPPKRVVLPGADHTCSAPSAQQACEAATVSWARRELGVSG